VDESAGEATPPGHSRCHKALTIGQGAIQVEVHSPNTLTTGQGFDRRADSRRISVLLRFFFQVLSSRA